MNNASGVLRGYVSECFDHEGKDDLVEQQWVQIAKKGGWGRMAHPRREVGKKYITCSRGKRDIDQDWGILPR